MLPRRSDAQWTTGPLRSLSLAIGLMTLSACASSTKSAPRMATPSASNANAAASMPMSAPSPDPRVGLSGGWFDAGVAAWNVELVSNTKPSEKFINPSTPGDRRLVNSDLAFYGNYIVQGNYSGYQVWDISNPRAVTLHTSYVCPGSQSDVSVYKNLMFVSAEAVTGRKDCGMQGVPDTVSTERARGIRIFDITDIAHPKPLTIVQTCRGSHTNTLVTDPNDNQNVYVYVSGSSTVRSPNELAGCSGATDDPNTALFRIEVIRVPLSHPQDAAIVSSPRIFQDLKPAQRHAETSADSAVQAARIAAAGGPPRQRPGAGLGPTQCHDITAYPAIGLAGGACGGYGILLDIRDVAHPKRINAVADSNFSAWHSVTFNNDGTKILFSDEWGGGSQPRCRATDNPKWGADAIYSLAPDGKMTFQNYYKMLAPQTQFENCVSHNGTLIPVPGRDIMVQAFYQGGLSIFDWTDAMHPKEIGFFDRGPMDSSKFVDAGYWSTYWYNGYIIGSEIARGMDILQLKASPLLTQNEIDAAKLVHFDYFNAQDQPKLVWPPAFVVARAYLDQLARDNGLSGRDAVAREVDRIEKLSGADRRSALTALATKLDGEANGSSDAVRVRKLAGVLRDLSNS